jgi:hypothetical protein
LVELTNDPFDDVEIKGVWRGGDENGMPGAEHVSANSNRQGTWWELRSIFYCRSAMAVTQSRECASRRVAPSQ